MSLLGPNGRPISATRRITVKLEVADQAAADSKTNVHALGFHVDSFNPADIDRLITMLGGSLRAKLTELGAYRPIPVPGPLAAGVRNVAEG